MQQWRNDIKPNIYYRSCACLAMEHSQICPHRQTKLYSAAPHSTTCTNSLTSYKPNADLNVKRQPLSCLFRNFQLLCVLQSVHYCDLKTVSLVEWYWQGKYWNDTDRGNTGMILTGEILEWYWQGKYSEKNMSMCHSAEHRWHTDWVQLVFHTNSQSVPRSKHTPSRLYKPVS